MSHMRKLENDQTLANEANYRNWTHRWQSHLDQGLAVGLPIGPRSINGQLQCQITLFKFANGMGDLWRFMQGIH